jgi:hypothetical protein
MQYSHFITLMDEPNPNPKTPIVLLGKKFPH